MLGPLNLPDFFAACLQELFSPFDKVAAATADANNVSSMPRLWLCMRNALFTELAVSFVGWAGLRSFFHDLLNPLRFLGMQQYEPEMLGLH